MTEPAKPPTHYFDCAPLIQGWKYEVKHFYAPHVYQVACNQIGHHGSRRILAVGQPLVVTENVGGKMTCEDTWFKTIAEGFLRLSPDRLFVATDIEIPVFMDKPGILHRYGICGVNADNLRPQGFPPESFDTILAYNVLCNCDRTAQWAHSCGGIPNSSAHFYEFIKSLVRLLDRHNPSNALLLTSLERNLASFIWQLLPEFDRLVYEENVDLQLITTPRVPSRDYIEGDDSRQTVIRVHRR